MTAPNEKADVRLQNEYLRDVEAKVMRTQVSRQQRAKEAHAIAKAALAFFDVPLGIAEIDREAVRRRVNLSGQRNWRTKGMQS